MTFFKDLRFYSAVAVISAMAACNYTLKRDSSSMSFDLNVSDLIIETPTTAEVVGGNFQLKQDGTGKLGCEVGANGQPTTGAGVVVTDIASFSTYLAFRFNFSFPIKPSSLNLLLQRTGATSASSFVEVTSATASEPIENSVIATSASVPVSSILQNATENISYSFGSNAKVFDANTNYAVLLRGVIGSGTLDGGNNFGWASGDDAFDCSNFSVMQRTLDSGGYWEDFSTRPYFFFELPIFKNDGSGYWIVDAGREFNWNLSSFSVNENSVDAAVGSVSYSVGVGSDQSVPSYTHEDLTLSQVKALESMTGRYLYIRLKITSANQRFSNATVSSGSIGGL